MSFLNPVNEPVLRFKSTDAGAPQINYNARVAGDVKAVLKACLVTGYGSTASAGWSIVNEVGNVAEFVSHSVAMSDYRLGIDDSSASSTSWYYQYQDVRTNPVYNAPTKTINSIDKTSNNNGWQLLVTGRGFYFIEVFQHTESQQKVTRMLWLGQVKSALVEATGINMSYFCTGYGATVANPYQLFDAGANGDKYRFYRLANYTRLDFNASNLQSFTTEIVPFGVSVVDVMSEVFLSASGLIVAAQAGLLLHTVNKLSDVLGVSDTTIGGRPVLSLVAGIQNATTTYVQDRSKRYCIYLDYWEY